MIKCGILSGDIIIAEKTPVAANGDIVVALLEDEATVKRFYKEDGHFRLQPENDDYAPIELSPIDFETGEARILGVAQEVKIKL